MSGTITTDHRAEFCNETHAAESRLAITPHCVECGDPIIRDVCGEWVHNLGEHGHPTVADATDADDFARFGRYTRKVAW